MGTTFVQIIPKSFNAKASLEAVRADLKAGRTANAVERLEQIRTFAPDNVEAIFFLGRIELRRKNADRARRLAEIGVKKDQSQPELWRLLGDANAALKKFSNAVTAFERGLALAPTQPGLQLACGIANAQLDQNEEAVLHFERAVKDNPETWAGWHNLGNALVNLKRYDEALEAFRTALKGQPENAATLYGLGRALIWVGEYEASIKYLSAALKRAPSFLQIISYKILALRHAGRADEANALEGLDDMVVAVTLSCPPEFASLDDFNAALRAEITNHPALTEDFGNRATRNGSKVDHMFAANKTPLFEIFERQVRGAFDLALTQMPRREGLAIPLNVEGGYRADMWANVMHRGGHQIAHNHPKGWFSASYYNTLPTRLETSGDAHEGWIEFGGTAYDFPAAPEMPTRLIKPELGMMVVFPSYIFHRTVPYDSDEARISCAFDAKPLKWGR